MLYVGDVEKTVRFYECALDGRCEHAHDDHSYAEANLGSLTLGVVDLGYARRHFPGQFRPLELSDAPVGMEIYVEVSDVEATCRRAVRAGATSLGDPVDRPWGRRSVFLRDPNGVVIEVASATQ
jgi:lactoylglutathione lyase